MADIPSPRQLDTNAHSAFIIPRHPPRNGTEVIYWEPCSVLIMVRDHPPFLSAAALVRLRPRPSGLPAPKHEQTCLQLHWSLTQALMVWLLLPLQVGLDTQPFGLCTLLSVLLILFLGIIPNESNMQNSGKKRFNAKFYKFLLKNTWRKM